MPIYDYSCEKCGEYEVYKSIKAYDGRDACPSCGSVGDRVFTPTLLIGTAVQSPEYNPGLGCVVRDKNHRAEICKARGLEEVGTEKVSSLRKLAKQTKQEKIQKKYLPDSDLRHLAETMRRAK
jgi:putative FmdB family regulatory protein